MHKNTCTQVDRVLHKNKLKVIKTLTYILKLNKIIIEKGKFSCDNFILPDR